MLVADRARRLPARHVAAEDQFTDRLQRAVSVRIEIGRRTVLTGGAVRERPHEGQQGAAVVREHAADDEVQGQTARAHLVMRQAVVAEREDLAGADETSAADTAR